eukprot:tig00000912_g5432.t1
MFTFLKRAWPSAEESHGQVEEDASLSDEQVGEIIGLLRRHALEGRLPPQARALLNEIVSSTSARPAGDDAEGPDEAEEATSSHPVQNSEWGGDSAEAEAYQHKRHQPGLQPGREGQEHFVQESRARPEPVAHDAGAHDMPAHADHGDGESDEWEDDDDLGYRRVPAGDDDFFLEEVEDEYVQQQQRVDMGEGEDEDEIEDGEDDVEDEDDEQRVFERYYNFAGRGQAQQGQENGDVQEAAFQAAEHAGAEPLVVGGVAGKTAVGSSPMQPPGVSETAAQGAKASNDGEPVVDAKETPESASAAEVKTDRVFPPDDLADELEVPGAASKKMQAPGQSSAALSPNDLVKEDTVASDKNDALIQSQPARVDDSQTSDGKDADAKDGLSHTIDDDEHVPDEEDALRMMREQQPVYESFDLKVIYERNRTGFEETKDFPIRINSVIAGRYQILEYLGSAAFSKAVQCLDLQTGQLICIKIIKNNKDFFDQSLDEIKLLKYINSAGNADEKHVLQLYDYFYYKEHLFIVCELLRDNLYEFSKYNRESGGDNYFTLPRLQKITWQCLTALHFIHSLNLIHCDLKPENILIKSYSRCEVKVIDFGSSCFITDHLSSYVQSRSYRAPEVILGMPYGQKIDMWSLGCILAELWTGNVLFHNDSIHSLLCRMQAIVGPFPRDFLKRGHYVHKYFTPKNIIYEKDRDTGRYVYLFPKRTTLRHRLRTDDSFFIDFIRQLLQIDPDLRPTAEEAMRHPWLSTVAI